MNLLEVCLQTNEAVGLSVYESKGRLYCLPAFEKEAFTEKITKSIWKNFELNKTLVFERRVYSMQFTLRKYWTLQDFKELEELEKLEDPNEVFKQALVVAKRVLKRSPKKLNVVCGPISTGPKGVRENLRIFNRTMYKISRRARMFNQLPFEAAFAHAHELLKKRKYRHLMVNKSSSLFFIKKFYRPLFAQDKIWKTNFIHDWKSSTGAREEHKIFRKTKASITYLKEGFDAL